MTGYILRPYDPNVLDLKTQHSYERDIRTQLSEYAEYWSLPEHALHIAIYIAACFLDYGDSLKEIPLSQFFLLVATLEQILDEVLFETEEEVLDGDGTLFTDLPKEEQDGLCALLLNICLQTLWPAAFLLPSPPFGAGEEEARSEKEEEERPFSRTTITITILTEGSYAPLHLDQVAYDDKYGDCSLAWERTSSTRLTTQEMKEALKEQGGDPTVFGFSSEEEQGPRSCCVCGLPAEGSDQVCTCVCPDCGEHLFDDLILSNRGRCWDCWKQSGTP